MREYVGIPARKTCNLQTFAFLIVDLGAGGPGFKSRRPDFVSERPGSARGRAAPISAVRCV